MTGLISIRMLISIGSIHPARDAVHIHCTSFLELDRGIRAEANPMCILYDRVAGHRVPASLTFSFIFNGHEDDEWLESMDLLENLG